MHFYWYQIFDLESAVVEAQKKMLSSHGGFLTIAMYHHIEKLTHYGETAKKTRSLITRSTYLSLIRFVYIRFKL